MAANSKKGLGNGLGAIFGSDIFEEKEEISVLPISKVEPRDDQPRTNFDETGLQELAQSIEKYGVIQPITVRPLPTGFYQIIAGERRWRASRLAGLTDVPVRVLEADDRRAMELALVENLQREDLNPVEEAGGYKTLLEDYGMTQEQVAQSVGRSRPAITNALRLLSLPEEVLIMLENGELSAGHARALLAIPRTETLIEAAQLVIDRGLTVRQTESLAARLSKEEDTAEEAPDPCKITVDYKAEVENDLGKVLARKVKIQQGKRKGYLQLEFYGKDDMEALIEALYQIRKQ